MGGVYSAVWLNQNELGIKLSLGKKRDVIHRNLGQLFRILSQIVGREARNFKADLSFPIHCHFCVPAECARVDTARDVPVYNNNILVVIYKSCAPWTQLFWF